MYGAYLIRALCQNDPPRDGLDILVGELHVHRKAVLKALQCRRAGKGCLPGSQEQQTISKALGARLDDFLNGKTAVRVIADVLLHFVQE